MGVQKLEDEKFGDKTGCKKLVHCDTILRH